MGQVSVSVNNQRYTLACRDGEEDRLLGLARSLDGKVRTLTARLGQVGDNKLLLMAALLFVDELDEVQIEMQKKEGGNVPLSESEAENRLTTILNEMAETVNGLAHELEKV